MWLTLVFLASCAAEAPTPSTPEPAPAPAPPPEPARPVVDLTVPTDVNLLRARLLEADAALRDPATDDETAAAWGHLQQRIYRSLADDAVLAGAVLEGLPEATRTLAQRAVEGTRAIARTVPRPKTDLPDWRIVPAKPAKELKGYYLEAEAKHGVPWSVLAAIHLNETRMGRLRGTSDAGAQGPMQFMPPTWKAYGEGDVNSDRDAILAAGNYLKEMGYAKDPKKAIWAYNHSEHYVKAIQDFAANFAADESTFRGCWGWQVYYRTVAGSIWLAEGYEQTSRIPIATYCDAKGEPYCPQMHTPPAPGGPG